MHHADFGGATNAVHLVLTKGIDIAIPSPASTIPRLRKHFVNAAARGGFQAIQPPPLIPADVARSPVVIEDLGRIDGLYDVCHSVREYAIPCVFKSTGWARRRLTAKEWLAVHDVPVVLVESLEADVPARNSIALALTPLLVGWIFCSFWGDVRGEGVA